MQCQFKSRPAIPFGVEGFFNHQQNQQQHQQSNVTQNQQQRFQAPQNFGQQVAGGQTSFGQQGWQTYSIYWGELILKMG